MKLSTFLVGVVMFSLFVGALSIPYANLGTSYNIEVDSTFNGTYDKVKLIDNSTMDVGEEIRGKDIGTFDAFFLAGKAILSSARIVFNSFGVVTTFAYELQTDLGIPTIFATAFTTIILIAIVFGIISLWARFRT